MQESRMPATVKVPPMMAQIWGHRGCEVSQATPLPAPRTFHKASQIPLGCWGEGISHCQQKLLLFPQELWGRGGTQVCSAAPGHALGPGSTLVPVVLRSGSKPTHYVQAAQGKDAGFGKRHLSPGLTQPEVIL